VRVSLRRLQNLEVDDLRLKVGNQKFQIKVTLAKNEKKKKKRFHLQ
jgi:hypothetical protein